MSESAEIKELAGEVKELVSSVNKLVLIEAARAEREKQQQKDSENFYKFIEENKEPLTRLKRWHVKVDKWGTTLGFMVILAVATASGFNFLK